MADLVYLYAFRPSNTRLSCKKINLLAQRDLSGEKLPARAGSERGNALQMARLLEGEISAPLRVGFRVANDNVVEQFDFENPSRLPQRTSDGYVGLAGAGVACYTAYGISGVMPHPVLCRMPGARSSE